MKKLQRANSLIPGGTQIFQRMFTRLGCSGRPPHFVTKFFRYANLTHTIRLRDEVCHARLSDLLCGAPLRVFEAVAAILLARMYRRRLPPEFALAYREYSLSAATRRRIHRLRTVRGRKQEHAPAGRHSHLDPVFDRLNASYFGGTLQRPRLAWSKRPWRSQYGCYDPALGQIVVSKGLDSPQVPPYVVDYILFHEMLHVKHPVRRKRCGLEIHSRDFQMEERRFAEYARARRFLLNFAP